MMLLRLIRSSVIAAALALLVTSLSFSAAMYPGEASSSAGPSAGPYGSGTVPSGMDLDTYIGKLKARNLKVVNPSISGTLSGHLLPDVPFYGRTPVFTTDSRVEAVVQALVDYKNLVIVDLQRSTARKVVYEDSILQESEIPSEQVQEFLFMYKFDGKLHVLMKHFQPGAPQGRYWPQKLPQQEPVELLPHFDQVPILESGKDDLPHMLGASKSGAKKFWLRRPDGDYLIDPQAQPPPSDKNIYKDPVIQIASEAQTQNIDEVLRRYDNVKLQYGEGTASLRYGAPVPPLSSEYQRKRIERTSLLKYKRFTMIAGKRPELLSALQKDGRYRLYDTVNPQNGPYKVKLKNPSAPPGTVMDIGIELLTPTEQRSESWLAELGLFKLPH